MVIKSYFATNYFIRTSFPESKFDAKNSCNDIEISLCPDDGSKLWLFFITIHDLLLHLLAHVEMKFLADYLAHGVMIHKSMTRLNRMVFYVIHIHLME